MNPQKILALLQELDTIEVPPYHNPHMDELLFQLAKELEYPHDYDNPFFMGIEQVVGYAENYATKNDLKYAVQFVDGIYSVQVVKEGDLFIAGWIYKHDTLSHALIGAIALYEQS